MKTNWVIFLDFYFLDKCANKDKSCDAFGQKGDKDIFCSIPWSVLNCPRICDKSCEIPLPGRGKLINTKDHYQMPKINIET